MQKEAVMTMTTLDEIAARDELAQGAWEDFQLGIATTRFALEEANNSAEDVKPMLAALRAVEAVVSERYKLWAAICGETCGKEVYGIDHDAIADSIAAAIETAIREALGS